MVNRWGNSGNSDRLYCGGSRITTDGDCSHKIKRHLLLGRKVMSPSQHIKKQRHYFATKVHLVKAMVFPVVMYGCDSCTIKKLSTEELMLLNVVFEKTLKSPLDCKEIQPVHPKRDQSSSHPHLPPQSPKVCSIHLCLFFCFEYRVIITIFLNSIYMC